MPSIAVGDRATASLISVEFCSFRVRFRHRIVTPRDNTAYIAFRRYIISKQYPLNNIEFTREKNKLTERIKIIKK